MAFTKLKQSSLFQKFFGFEAGIDITDETQVLFRKNVVIKNIIFLSNIIYTLIFAIISLGHPSNWVLTIILFPLTFFVNSRLKKMIHSGKDEFLKQQIAMYMCCFYMFLTAILIYLRLKTGGLANTYGEVGYVLLYYSLAVVSFYQDKKLLKIVFQWLLVIVTIIHFTLTYNIIGYDYATDIKGFITIFFTSTEFKDILLRTIILLIFMLVLYSIVGVSGYIEKQRKAELIKRKSIQEDFTKVVKRIFNVTLNSKNKTEDELNQLQRTAIMSEKLAFVLGIEESECIKIKNYSLIHVEKEVVLPQSINFDNDSEFDELKKQTLLGSKIISRLELERKVEDIIRAHIEGTNTQEFINNMKELQNNRGSQIIMLCEMYVTLRSIKSYKKAFNHRISMEMLTQHYNIYYDNDILDRFIRFNEEFENIYDN